MAGTAEGIRKANAARAAKRFMREQARLDSARATRAKPTSPTTATTTTPDVVATVVDPRCDSLTVVEPSIVENSTGGQRLALALVDSLAPVAVAELASLLRNRKSASLRLAAACKIVDLAFAKDRAGPPDDEALDEATGRVVRSFERVSGLRRAAAGAETVEPIPATPSKSQDSGT